MKYLLVVTYLSVQGGVSVQTYDMPSLERCTSGGKTIQANVKAGRVTTVCWKVKA